MDPQALLALQLLTKTITDLPLAIQRVMAAGAAGAAEGNGRVSAFDRPSPVIVMGPKPLPVTGVGGSGETGQRAAETVEKKPAGMLSQLFGALGAKFAAILGPFALLNAVVGSTISGFQTMGTAVKVLAGTLAPILLPATLLISTALVALSDVVLATLMPGLESFFGIILSLGIPALVAFIGAIMTAAEFLQRNSPSSTEADLVSGAASDITGDGEASWLQRKLGTYYVAARAGLSLLGGETAPERGPGDTRPDPTTIVMGALRDVMGSLRLSLGPKAQISGLEGLGKSVQLAALNQDPLEARMLRTQQQILMLMERAVNRVDAGRSPYTPGEGDFSGDTGPSARDGGGDF